MLTKLDTVRIKNVLDAIQRLERAAERLEKSEDPYLKARAKTILAFAEDDIVMELTLELAREEDNEKV